MSRAVWFSLSFVVVNGCSAGGSRSGMVDLAGSIEPFRERFNADKDTPRVVALLSPV